MHRLRNLLLFLGLLLTSTAHAQTLPEPVQYIVAPETPGPKAMVLIEAQGVGGVLGSAQITWRQDGAVAKRGVGERLFSFTAGALGSRTTISVDIAADTGTYRKTFVFSPSLVTMLWEADTTAPPLYRGKPLYTAGSNLRVFAYPTVYSGSARVAQEALTYRWQRSGELVTEASGLGKFAYAFAGDQLQQGENIAVDVYYGAAKVARGELLVPAVNPEVVLYPRDPLRGVLYDQALPTIRLGAEELSVQGVGYYFSRAAQRGGQLSYQWLLNGQEATGPEAAQGILTLRQTGSGQGSATLGLQIQNNNSSQFVQQAAASLQILFGGQTGSIPFFGL